jgi:protein O-mannosyl-transferase
MGRKHKKAFKNKSQDSESGASVQHPARPDDIRAAWSKRTSKITTLWAVVAIVLAGFAVYFSGLSNDFLVDDSRQVVNNPVIQSISNIPQLFNGSTAFSGTLDGKLIGVYYRPLMMVSYSLIHSVFGLNQVAFHVVQLATHILAAIVLFLFFRYSFRSLLALGLSLVFLVHPINSQSVFYVASLQEPLYLLFGILALWLLLRYSSVKSLMLVVACLFLSLLSKETGILFVIMAAVYLLVYDRKRLYSFLGFMTLPVILYFILRTHALGISTNPHLGQIDELNIWGRLATTPSIWLFYMSTFIFPAQFAHLYYWAYPSPTLSHFFLPLLVDLAFVGLITYLASMVRRKLSHQYFLTFNFFALWFFLGLALHSQIIPLDLTANTAWFYFPIVGLLGMIGVATMLIPPRVPVKPLIGLACIIIGLLGLRTAIRGFDWANDATLAYHDVKISKEDYNSEFEIARDLAGKGKYAEARPHAERAIALYPTTPNYEALGYICVWQGSLDENRKALKKGIDRFPKDPMLWMYLAIVEYKNGDIANAKASISQAYSLTHALQIQGFYTTIMNDQPLNL